VDILTWIEDILLVQKHTIKKASRSFVKNWLIIFISIAYMILFIFFTIAINSLLSGILSILAGIIIAIVSSGLISSYLYLLFNIINNNRITFQNIKDGFTEYLWKIYGIFFIVWLVSYILSSISGIIGSSIGLIDNLFNLAVLILLNALPETIYQKYYSSSESIKYAFEFIKENWLNWFLPNIVFFVLLYITRDESLTSIFIPYISFFGEISSADIIRYIIAQVIFSFAMVYRGYLFQLLSTSTRRKRMFMKNMYR